MSIASLLPDDVGLKALSAVVAMQPSIYRSFKTVSDQALGNVIGAILSVTMVTIFSDNFIIMGVTVIVLIAILFKFNLAHVATLASVTALISAVVAMQPSIYRSFKTVSDQALGNVIGAILSVTMVTIFSDNFIIMGVTVIVLIAILFKFNLAHVATLASVTALIIMGQHTGSFYITAFGFVLVMIGVISSSLVNFVFLPPKFETKFTNSLNISSDIFMWFKLVLNDTTEFNNIKQDSHNLKQRVEKLDLWRRTSYYKNIFTNRIERKYFSESSSDD